MRLINFVALGVLLGLVFLIYELKYETRRLESRAAELSRSIEEEKDNLAVMRAEWSLVSRPERVAQMAERLLGLKPVKPEQIVPFQELAFQSERRAAPQSAPLRHGTVTHGTATGGLPAIETTGALAGTADSRSGRGETSARRDDIGALINSLTRRADDDRPAQ